MTPTPSAPVAAPSKAMSIFAGIIHTLAVLAPVASVAFTIWGRNARTISEVQETAQVFSGMGQQLP